MFKAIAIRMNDNASQSWSCQEIHSIKISGKHQSKFYLKEDIHDYLVNNGGTIKVDRYPYPNLIPVNNGVTRYVRSEPNDTVDDNLLRLPRE